MECWYEMIRKLQKRLEQLSREILTESLGKRGLRSQRNRGDRASSVQRVIEEVRKQMRLQIFSYKLPRLDFASQRTRHKDDTYVNNRKSGSSQQDRDSTGCGSIRSQTPITYRRYSSLKRLSLCSGLPLDCKQL